MAVSGMPRCSSCSRTRVSSARRGKCKLMGLEGGLLYICWSGAQVLRHLSILSEPDFSISGEAGLMGPRACYSFSDGGFQSPIASRSCLRCSYEQMLSTTSPL